ncbi:MAG: amino acid-binding protein [Geodermatophilaceae bacterium]|nr:amino acid-binding protein [Geodermatophilaceae bacterium]MDQ3476899.1 amino acid-binding protein [Actinomycetota bacterium]
MSYLLRVVVPDRPGMLGALATSLGAAGADIVSIDVVQRAGGEAIDDIVVELPPERLPDGLITAARSVEGVSVESLRPFSGTLDTHRELALVEALAGSGTGVAQLLADELPRIFRASWALLVGCPPPYGRDPTVIAASAAAPEIVEDEIESLPWCPMPTPTLLDSEADDVPTIFSSLGTEMMGAPMGDPCQVVLVGRAGGPPFLRSELLRLAHLVGIAATVATVEA